MHNHLFSSMVWTSLKYLYLVCRVPSWCFVQDGRPSDLCQVQQNGVWPSWRPLQEVQEDWGAGGAASSLLLCSLLLWSPLWAEVSKFVLLFHLHILDLGTVRSPTCWHPLIAAHVAPWKEGSDLPLHCSWAMVLLLFCIFIEYMFFQ